MSLQLVEGFDNFDFDFYPTYSQWEYALDWNNTEPGRYGGLCLESNSYITSATLRSRVLESHSTWIWGCVMGRPSEIVGQAGQEYPDDLPYLLRLFDNGTIQCTFHLITVSSTTYRIDLYRGRINDGTLLASSQTFDVASGWAYWEVKTTIGDSGSWEVRKDGVSVFAGNGDLQNNGNPSANQVGFYIAKDENEEISMKIDDIIAMNGSGATFNDFIGDRVIEAVVMSGAGDSTDWTANSGDNWAALDEVEDSRTVSAANVGDKDLYTLTPLAYATGDIEAVMIEAIHRLDTAGSLDTQILFKDNVAGEANAGAAITSDDVAWTRSQVILENNPATGSPFSASEIDNGQIGLEHLG